MGAKYVVIGFRRCSSQKTAVLGTGKSSSDHDSFCSTATRQAPLADADALW
jgi:hypothetical protein